MRNRALHGDAAMAALRLWVDGRSLDEIASHVGVTAGQVRTASRRMGWPKRQRVCTGCRTDDPSPEEIAQRAAEVRAMHLRQLRGEP